MQKKLKTFSIITPVLNNKDKLIKTIKSIKKQNFQDYEIIVVDGGSNDGTKEYLDSEKTISKIIIENDRGIYDAINKGIINSNNSIIGLLHSDDTFYSKNVLEEYSKVFKKNIDIVFSNLQIINKKNKILRNWRSSNFYYNSFKNGWSPPHPTFFVHKKFYDKYGLYDLNYKIASDIDLMFRFMEIFRLRSYHLDLTSVVMKTGGLSNKNLKNKILLNFEIIKILNNYYGKKFSIIKFLFKKFFYKINQYKFN